MLTIVFLAGQRIQMTTVLSSQWKSMSRLTVCIINWYILACDFKFQHVSNVIYSVASLFCVLEVYETKWLSLEQAHIDDVQTCATPEEGLDVRFVGIICERVSENKMRRNERQNYYLTSTVVNYQSLPIIPKTLTYCSKGLKLLK